MHKGRAHHSTWTFRYNNHFLRVLHKQECQVLLEETTQQYMISIFCWGVLLNTFKWIKDQTYSITVTHSTTALSAHPKSLGRKKPQRYEWNCILHLHCFSFKWHENAGHGYTWIYLIHIFFLCIRLFRWYCCIPPSVDCCSIKVQSIHLESQHP